MHSISKKLGSLLIAAGIGFASLSAHAEVKTVTISQAFQSMLYLPLYIAIDKGFFQDQGLSVIKETAGSPTAALSSVLSGSSQFSIHGPEWTAIAASKGANVGIISNAVNGAAVWIATAPDVKFNNIKDIKGQKVVTGLMPTTSTSLFLKLLKENGMSEKSDIDMIQVPLGTEPATLLGGQAKVAVLYEPGLDQVAIKGMKVVLGFPKTYGPYAFSSITAMKNVDPVSAQRMVNGMEMALQFIAKDPKGAIEVAKKEFPSQDPQVVENAVNRMISENVFPKTVQITPQALKIAMDTQIALGNLKEQPVYENFINETYIKNALNMK
ncbi:ABC transporter substrate-binding protein [Polynucleobacter sp. MWH-P3-07-1]|jgi:NitT/TauT family transport system substrate-binding protein|uniref:ABC transporter substrate-binding protein n=1 Tax=Polynucleobacter sp. MWH-P3-07-1 TaxID=1743173 RepID=UPI001BFCE546|nr:ABC transporter substrate-binding protein [Polynucleobacter sp. MWH-P3-07-1]QWD83899.1 ABC transporter substrate-binding protein [Polynucleobacter sp. MWH-P3-07-1]QWD92137.1 ABC transporter substrate-binding protein [Polynucleobacter asymbioticus]